MTDAEVLEKQYSFEYVMPEKEVTEEMHQIAYNDWSTGDDHSMLIVGIAHDQNGTKYYKVKNSWGETGPYAGYWYCSEQFVRLHTVFFTVNKAAFSNKMRQNLGIK
jgi:bleomycin hydrolase